MEYCTIKENLTLENLLDSSIISTTGKLMSSIEHFETETAAIHYRPNGSVQASGYYNPSPIGVEPTKQEVGVLRREFIKEAGELRQRYCMVNITFGITKETCRERRLQSGSEKLVSGPRI